MILVSDQKRFTAKILISLSRSLKIWESLNCLEFKLDSGGFVESTSNSSNSLFFTPMKQILISFGIFAHLEQSINTLI